MLGQVRFSNDGSATSARSLASVLLLGACFVQCTRKPAPPMIDNDRSDAAPSPPPPAGPSTVEPETIFVAQNRVRGLAIAGDRAYFSEADEYVDRFGSDSACIDGKVGSIGRDGAGPPVWVTPRPKCPGSIVVVGDHVVFREPGGSSPSPSRGRALRGAKGMINRIRITRSLPMESACSSRIRGVIGSSNGHLRPTPRGPWAG